MTNATREAQTREMRGVLAVVVMLLMAGIFTILFAAGQLSEQGKGQTDVELNSASVSEDKR